MYWRIRVKPHRVSKSDETVAATSTVAVTTIVAATAIAAAIAPATKRSLYLPHRFTHPTVTITTNSG